MRKAYKLLITSLAFGGWVVAEPIQTCAPAPASLVSWWPGDGHANDIADSNDGTLVNGTTFAPGLVGQAFSFDGNDDFVEVPNSSSLMIAGAFTVEFWFKLNATHDSSTPRSPNFFSKGFDNSIGLANNDGRLEVRGPVPRPNSTRSSWIAGVWYHVGVTYDSTAYRIYVNGVEEGSVTSGYSILNNQDDVALGSNPFFLDMGRTGVTVNGLIDEVALYDRALSASEIQDLFNAGSAGKCTDSCPSGLNFNGFLAPVGGADATGGSFSSPVRSFKLNSTIPLRFTISCSGVPVTTGVHTLEAVKWSNQTTSDPALDATPTDAATIGNQFRLTGDEWHFNLDSKATGMSVGTWQLIATLSDGSEHSVWIQIK